MSKLERVLIIAVLGTCLLSLCIPQGYNYLRQSNYWADKRELEIKILHNQYEQSTLNLEITQAEISHLTHTYAQDTLKK